MAARSSAIVPDGAAAKFLDSIPVSLLCGRLGDDADDLPNELERLGISTLGQLAGLPRDAVADRFGRLGLRALRLARGEDDPLRPRPVREAIAVELELPEAVSGQQLERVLELLISRLLAHGERRGRTLRALRLSARLAAGGGWRREVALRRASSDRARLADALLPHLALLPSPAATLRLEAVALGPETGEQLTLSSPEQERRRRISEAVRQTRSAAGADAVLRVLEVDPESRVPERREVLMPCPRCSEARSNPSDGGDVRPGRVNKPWPVPVQTGPTGRRWRSGGWRWSRCARSGWSRTAGGRRNPCKGATSRWSSPTAATSSSSASRIGRWFRQRD